MSGPWKYTHRDQLIRDIVLCLCQVFLPGKQINTGEAETLRGGEKKPQQTKNQHQKSLTWKSVLLKTLQSTKGQNRQGSGGEKHDHQQFL